MEISKIFVVYDPTRAEQPALVRAAGIAAEIGCKVHVFAAIYADIGKGDSRPAEIKHLIACQKTVLEGVVAPLLVRGIDVNTEVQWEKVWYTAVARASIRNDADVVLKSSYRHSTRERILNRTSDWTLIRECLCPVLLVKEGKARDLRRVLAAIDIRSGRESYEKLNEHIINLSKRILDTEKAEVHFINAFKDFHTVPDRNTLIRNCGVSSDRIHIQMGEPDDVIVRGARDLDASLVVIGNSARSGLSAVINGNTVERVLDRLDCDVLSMP